VNYIQSAIPVKEQPKSFDYTNLNDSYFLSTPDPEILKLNDHYKAKNEGEDCLFEKLGVKKKK